MFEKEYKSWNPNVVHMLSIKYNFKKVNYTKNFKEKIKRRVISLNMESPYKYMYKTWLFKWIVYNQNLSYSKKEFIKHKLWKQHLIFFFSIAVTILLISIVIKAFTFLNQFIYS